MNEAITILCLPFALFLMVALLAYMFGFNDYE